MASLKGKVGLVTGAAQGIGYGVASMLLQHGAKVCLVDINDEKGNAVTKLLQQEYGQDAAIFVKCDVTCDDEFAHAFMETKETFGGLDIVGNIAGLADEWNWKRVIDVNLTGVVRGTMLAVEHMSLENGAKGGVVVNMASSAGLEVLPFVPVYSATKHAIVAYTRAMAANTWYTDKGLRVNCICPHGVDTSPNFFVTVDKVYGGQAAVDDAIAKSGAPVSVPQVAEAFLQAALDSSLNGAAIIVKNTGSVLSLTVVLTISTRGRQILKTIRKIIPA